MGKALNPRKGSMQFWPRKRAKRMIARLRSFVTGKDAKPAGFAGYKAGMTHITYIDNYSNSITKGEEVASAVTIVECPPLKVYGVRLYKKEGIEGLKAVKDILSKDVNKELKRKIVVSKKKSVSFDNLPDYDEIRLIVYTQPHLTGFGRKKPDVFEFAIGGKKEEQLNYAKEKLGKEISFSEIFKEGDYVDAHGITKGKGYQGPVKRFGVAIQRPKKEKIKRGVGARSGGWCGQAHMMFRVATAGQMGTHQRTEYNKLIVKISDKPEEINPKGGIVRYGLVKGNYILIKGSIIGPKKRLAIFTPAQRPLKNPYTITPKYISTESQQGM
jgi:large subunit ribosomal protein L3